MLNRLTLPLVLIASLFSASGLCFAGEGGSRFDDDACEALSGPPLELDLTLCNESSPEETLTSMSPETENECQKACRSFLTSCQELSQISQNNPAPEIVKNTQHPDKKPYACSFQGCSFKFYTKHKLDRHQTVHTGEKLHVCNMNGCGRKFARSDILKIHQMRHTGEKRYACPVKGCDFRSAHRASIIRHELKHARKTHRYSFDGCNYSCSALGITQIHALIHDGQKPYACFHSGCSKAFFQSEELARHKMAHEFYNCSFPDCDFQCTTLDDFAHHEVTHYPSGKSRFVCSYEGCHFKSPVFNYLKTHEDNHHGQVQTLLSCSFEDCDFKCVNSYNLKKHEGIHGPRKQFACPIQGCPYIAERPYNLKRHQKTHVRRESGLL